MKPHVVSIYVNTQATISDLMIHTFMTQAKCIHGRAENVHLRWNVMTTKDAKMCYLCFVSNGARLLAILDLAWKYEEHAQCGAYLIM